MNDTDLGALATPYSLTKRKLGKLATKYATGGKVATVLHEFKAGKLRSGSKKGPQVTDRKQAIAIALSEKRKALGEKYADGGTVKPMVPGIHAAPLRPNWWQRLQEEIAALTPQTPLRSTAVGATGGAPAVAPEPQTLTAQQVQPSAPAFGKARGGKVRA